MTRVDIVDGKPTQHLSLTLTRAVKECPDAAKSSSPPPYPCEPCRTSWPRLAGRSVAHRVSKRTNRLHAIFQSVLMVATLI